MPKENPEIAIAAFQYNCWGVMNNSEKVPVVVTIYSSGRREVGCVSMSTRTNKSGWSDKFDEGTCLNVSHVSYIGPICPYLETVKNQIDTVRE